MNRDGRSLVGTRQRRAEGPVARRASCHHCLLHSQLTASREIIMSIVIACPSCEAKMKAPDSAVGKKVKCPGCGEPLTVRAPVGAAPVRREQPINDLDRSDERPRKLAN